MCMVSLSNQRGRQSTISSSVTIILLQTFASGSSQPGLGGGCLKSLTDSIMWSLSSMSLAFFWIWLARDSNLVMA